MNMNPIDVDLALAIAENTRRELTARSRVERMREQAGLAEAPVSVRRVFGHGLIRIGYRLMAPRDSVFPQAVNPVRF